MIVDVNANADGNTVTTQLEEDRIANFHSNKVYFITGASGFVGKILLEWLLRKCYSIPKIYILLRKKKGVGSQERVKNLLNISLFEKVRARWGDEKIFSRVRAVEGDVFKLRLGLSDKDYTELTKNVNIIMHSAATIRFDESLKSAVLLNTRGTRMMLELAENCRKLLLFQYVSTAYCHSHIKNLKEQTYDPPFDPHMMIRMAETFDDTVLEQLTPIILGDLPNTYALSKALSEGICNEYLDKLPVMIVRPSIVIPCWREPIPGWCDNMNGPLGLIYAGGAGVLRSVYMKPSYSADFVPVDVFANVMYASAWNYIVNKDTSMRVLNVTTQHVVSVNWRQVIDESLKLVFELPPTLIAWYPNPTLRKSQLKHRLATFCFQVIPSTIGDGLLKLIGYEPVLLRIQRRLAKGMSVLQYYTNNEWYFEASCFDKINALCTPLEYKTYGVIAADFNILEYVMNAGRGCRKYIIGESDDTIPQSKKRMRIFYVADRLLKCLIIYWFLKFVFNQILYPLLVNVGIF